VKLIFGHNIFNVFINTPIILFWNFFNQLNIQKRKLSLQTIKISRMLKQNYKRKPFKNKMFLNPATCMYHNSILLINAFKPVPFAGSIDFHWQIVCNFPFSFYAVFFFALLCYLPCHCVCVWLSTFFRLGPQTLEYMFAFVIIRIPVVCRIMSKWSFGQSQFTCRWTEFCVLLVLLVNLLLFYAINPRLWKPLWRT